MIKSFIINFKKQNKKILSKNRENIIDYVLYFVPLTRTTIII